MCKKQWPESSVPDVKNAIASGEIRHRISSKAMKGLGDLAEEQGLKGNILELLERIGDRSLTICPADNKREAT